MNRFSTYAATGFSVIAIAATVDFAFGLGGGILLADICRTILEDDASGAGMGMGDMPMEIKPVPLIALSLGITCAAIWALTADHRRALAGRSAPNEEEQAAILSAILLVSAAQGKTSREEIMDVFRIVTSHTLNDELVDFALARFGALQGADLAQYRFEPVATSIGRRRALAAALMVGCVARQATPFVSELIERMAVDIGATAEDVVASRQALTAWQSDCYPVQGVSLVTILRHRHLTLRPT